MLETVKLILTIVQVLTCVGLIAIVLLQSGKESGLGALAGNNETYMSKSSTGTLDKKLAAATKWVALAWGVLTLVLCLL